MKARHHHHYHHKTAFSVMVKTNFLHSSALKAAVFKNVFLFLNFTFWPFHHIAVDWDHFDYGHGWVDDVEQSPKLGSV